jgi:DNA-binding CsgD family transcriptional regulator
MRAAWPLVGRTEILDQARQDLRRGEVSGIFLCGPAGVGKTRLASEIAEFGAAAGFHVERATASQSARGIPLGALAPLLPPAALAVERGIAMHGQATEALMQRSGGKRLLLLVDDAQWLDDASALLFHQLVSSRIVFAVASLRTGEAVPDSVQAVWKNGLCDRVDVGPLDRDEVEVLLEQVLGDPLEGVALQQLWEISEGNVQYLRELVLAGIDTGRLVDEGGMWRTFGRITPSERLHDLVGERLAGLDDDEIATLELVAFGEPLGVDVLAELIGSEPLVRLERKGLIETALDGRRFEATLAHPVHGDVVRERTPLTRAREVQRLLADAVESHHNRRRADVLKVALWRVEAGGTTSPELLIEAARQAGFAHDLETALRLAQAAHEIDSSFASGQIIADSLYSLGRSEETEQVLADLEDEAADDNQRATLIRVRVYNRYWHDGDLTAALEVIEHGREVITDPDHLVELEGLQAVLEVTSGRVQDGVERGLKLLDASYDRAVVQASLACSLGLPLLGRFEEASEAVTIGLRAYSRLGGQLTLYEPSLLVVAQSLSLAYDGQLAEADRMSEEGYDQALVADDAAGWAFFAMARGVVALDHGLLDEAIRWWTEAAGLFRYVNHFGPLGWSLLGVTLGHAMQGEIGAADTAITDEATLEHPADFHCVNRCRARAWVAVAKGHPADAKEHLEDAWALAFDRGEWPLAAMVLHDLARVGHPDPERAELLVERPIGALGLARVQHVMGLGTGDLELTGDAADEFGAMEANLLAAEAAFGLAAEHRRRGSPRDATAWTRKASTWAALCPGARTPGLAMPDEPVALTKREREVAVLAARGITSKDIAERLFVSVRTVDNHLGRVYDKLGIASRAELAEMMAGDS